MNCFFSSSVFNFLKKFWFRTQNFEFFYWKKLICPKLKTLVKTGINTNILGLSIKIRNSFWRKLYLKYVWVVNNLPNRWTYWHQRKMSSDHSSISRFERRSFRRFWQRFRIYFLGWNIFKMEKIYMNYKIKNLCLFSCISLLSWAKPNLFAHWLNLCLNWWFPSTPQATSASARKTVIVFKFIVKFCFQFR